MDDAELVDRARRGDQAAFGELVERHRHAVYRAALAVLRSHADAEDAAQDAFIKAFRHLDRFRGDSSVKTWLLTIAWREAINRRRSLTTIWRHLVDRQAAADEADPLESAAATGPDPEQGIASDRLHRHIRDAIESLTPKLRDVFLLAQSGDHTYQEIGAMTGVPVGTIKWRVSEARRLVKDHLRRRGYLHVG